MAGWYSPCPCAMPCRNRRPSKSPAHVLPRLGPPSSRQTRAQPHSYLNAVQKLARHQLNATQRHHCQRLQPAHTAELANQMVAKTSQRHAPLPLPHAEAWAERPLPGIDGLGCSLTPHRTAATPTRWGPRSSTGSLQTRWLALSECPIFLPPAGLVRREASWRSAPSARGGPPRVRVPSPPGPRYQIDF